MLTVEFGEKRPAYVTRAGRAVEHGEWHLWLYDCAWRVESAGAIVCGRDDDRAYREQGTQLLDGRSVAGTWLSQFGELTVAFHGDIVLRTFAAGGHADEQWILFVPDGRVITAAASGAFVVESKPGADG